MRSRIGLRVLARNVLSNWAGLLVNVVVAFLLTPYVLNHLGVARYGIWLLSVELTGYFGLLDFGFRPSLTMHLTRALAQGDERRVNEVASSGMVALGSAATLVALASVAGSWLAPRVLNVDASLQYELAICILVTGLSAALQFPFFLSGSILVATQRYDLSNGVAILTRLVTAGLTVWSLDNGYGLIGLCVVTAIGNVGGYVAQWLIARRLVPALALRPEFATWRTGRDLASYSAWTGMIGISGQLLWYSDKLVIAVFLPVEAVTRYGLAQAVSRYYQEFLTVMSQVFFPAATHLVAVGASEELRRVFLVASRFLLLCAGLLGIIGAVWADAFFRLWLGPANVLPNDYPGVAQLFFVLLAASLALFLPGVGGQILLGARRVREMAQIVFAEAIANLVLSVVLIQYVGLWGVALGTLIPAVIFRGFGITRSAGRLVETGVAEYFRAVSPRPALAVGILLPLLLAIRQLIDPDAWPALLQSGALALGAAVVVAGMIGLTRDERRVLLVRAGSLLRSPRTARQRTQEDIGRG